MSGRKKEKELIAEHRKSIILESAESLFLKKGYDETTMQDVADEAGYSKGTVYNYFNSKDELYLQSGIKAYELIIEITNEHIEREDPGMKQVIAIGRAFYDFTKKHPNYASIFHDIAMKLPDIETKEHKSDIEMKYLESSMAYGKLFIDVLSKAMKKNALRRDKNPYLIGFVISQVTRSIVSEILEHPNSLKKFKIKADEVVDFTFELLAEGLKPRE